MKTTKRRAQARAKRLRHEHDYIQRVDACRAIQRHVDATERERQLAGIVESRTRTDGEAFRWPGGSVRSAFEATCRRLGVEYLPDR